MEKLLSFSIREQTSHTGKLESVRSVGGGSINRCFAVHVDGADYFVKCNQAHVFPMMFENEVRGLDLLRSAGSFRVPRAHGITYFEDHCALVMEFIPSGHGGEQGEAAFGEYLASLHQTHDAKHGLDHHNYIGSLPQHNERHTEWIAFFAQERLWPMAEQAQAQGLLTTVDMEDVESLIARLAEFFPTESPSLLHGDLWAGNHMYDESGKPVVFDPAVYFGHRYMDLGMMRLFGGYGPRVFEAYEEQYPLQKDWEEGAEVANTYPLLVHVNLFGGSYVSQLRRILQRYR